MTICGGDGELSMLLLYSGDNTEGLYTNKQRTQVKLMSALKERNIQGRDAKLNQTHREQELQIKTGNKKAKIRDIRAQGV